MRRNDLKHSVAFRVTEDEWKTLKRKSEQEGITVPQMAKEALFGKVGLVVAPRTREYHGQAGRTQSK